MKLLDSSHSLKAVTVLTEETTTESNTNPPTRGRRKNLPPMTIPTRRRRNRLCRTNISRTGTSTTGDLKKGGRRKETKTRTSTNGDDDVKIYNDEWDGWWEMSEEEGSDDGNNVTEAEEGARR